MSVANDPRAGGLMFVAQKRCAPARAATLRRGPPCRHAGHPRREPRGPPGRYIGGSIYPIWVAQGPPGSEPRWSPLNRYDEAILALSTVVDNKVRRVELPQPLEAST